MPARLGMTDQQGQYGGSQTLVGVIYSGPDVIYSGPDVIYSGPEAGLRVFQR